MTRRIQIIHVGNMANKGTQALLSSEISILHEIYDHVQISVSTMDVDGVNSLGLAVEEVMPSLIDVPYSTADSRARRLSYKRGTLRFKVDLVLRSFFAPIQALIAFASCLATSVGFPAFYRVNLIHALKRCSLVISTSDENFKEGNLKLPFNIGWLFIWWSLLFVRTCDVFFSKRIFKKKIVVFPNSIGPFRTFIGRLLAKIALHHVDLILLREESSLAILEDLGIKTPKIVTTDVAMNFTSTCENTSRGHVKPTIGVAGGAYYNVLTEKEIRRYVVAHAKALDYMIEKYNLNVVFLPHDVTGFENDDYDICLKILYEMRNKQKAEINVFKNVHDYKRFLIQLDILVSSKMHPAVLAASSNVPFMYVVYDHKQTGFAKQVGLLHYCIDITAISTENLRREMEQLWKSRKDIQKLLENLIPNLKRDLKKKIRKATSSLQLPIGPN